MGKFEIDDGVAFVGRTFEEYVDMFGLKAEELQGEEILDCPAGPSSFVAEANDRGLSATAVDVMYDLPPDELSRRWEEDFEDHREQYTEKKDFLDFDYYGGLEERTRYLREACKGFLEDYPEGRTEGRYIYAELPTVPFPDDSFSLVLSSHLLFTFGDRLDYDFHVRTLDELTRVSTDEVRVYPVHELSAERYRRLDDVLEYLRSEGYAVDVREVTYEVLPGANETLVVSV